jgi:hypothetical protein
MVFWAMTPCSLVRGYQHSYRTDTSISRMHAAGLHGVMAKSRLHFIRREDLPSQGEIRGLHTSPSRSVVRIMNSRDMLWVGYVIVIG